LIKLLADENVPIEAVDIVSVIAFAKGLNDSEVLDLANRENGNPGELEILGDSTQRKSYLYVTDCVEAFLLGLDKAQGRVEVFNFVGGKSPSERVG